VIFRYDMSLLCCLFSTKQEQINGLSKYISMRVAECTPNEQGRSEIYHSLFLSSLPLGLVLLKLFSQLGGNQLLVS
jgi:hypothetical protein